MLLIQLIFLFGVGMKYHGSLFKKNKTEITGWFMPGTGSGKTDPNGHLEMPGTRMITCPNETLRTYFANTKSTDCPVGYSQEETIKKIWEINIK